MEKIREAIIAHLKLLTPEDLKLIYQIIRKLARR